MAKIPPRTTRLVTRLKRLRSDAFLVSNPSHGWYLSGFRCDDSFLLVSPKSRAVITDFRYAEEAEKAAPAFQIVERKNSLIEAVVRQCRKLGCRRLAFESNYLTHQQFTQLGQALPKVELVPTSGVLEGICVVKTAEERRAIERALRVAETAFLELLPLAKPGVSEKDLADELDFRMRRLGAEEAAFPVIVAGGPRSASPHAEPTGRKIRPGEPILFDWGARVDGYVCDLTRVACWGRIPPKLERIHEIVLAAQRRAIRRIRPGADSQAVDGAARKRIGQAGFGRRFGHALGHGIGRQVHEAPGLGPWAGGKLRRGMIFTVEPGIYLPGWGGVRIEDNVVVTATGSRRLSSLSRELMGL